MFFAGKKLKQAKQLIRQGELNRACRIARQVDFAGSLGGRRIANQLIDRLVDRAGRSSFGGDLSSAWRDLADASSVATDQNVDRVSKETSKLVDRTIDYAQAMLLSGKPANAESAIELLTERRILDRRANELHQVCTMILKADDLAATGRLNDATSLLHQTKQLRPDLTFLDSRIRNSGYQAGQLAELTSELRFAINQSAWKGAHEVSNRILQIAPKNQIALDARRRCDTKQDHALNSIFWINENGQQETGGSQQDQATHYDNSTASKQAAKEELVLQSGGSENRSGPMRSFMLWIDGVGGFLVCSNPQITIGRAVPHCGIDIPVQADLRRHHLKIKRVENQYLASSPGGVEVESDDGSDWTLLKDRQHLDLGSGVKLRFRQTHPLGNSARLEFTSRHRTEPWSDAVILLGDAILLGRETANHVCCPRWKDQLVIFRQGDEIYLRAEGEVEVNGTSHIGDILLQDGTQVIGGEFSISCEEVSGP